MAQVDRIRLPGTDREVRPEEWTTSPLYSTVEISADGGPENFSELRFFSYGKGGEVPGSPNLRSATEMDTNFIGRGNAVQENSELFIYGFRFEFTTVPAPGLAGVTLFQAQASGGIGFDAGHPALPGVSAKNMKRIHRDTLFKFTIANSKNYMEHPIDLFPGAMGVHAEPYLADGLDGNPLEQAFHGDVQERQRRKLGTPHHVEPGERFQASLVFPHGSVRDLALGDAAADPLAGQNRIRCQLFLEGWRKRPVA